MKRGACLLFAVLAVAGCGGTGGARLSRDAYETKLRAALARPLFVAHSPPKAAIDSLGKVAARFGDIASRLSGVRAPSDVQALNDRLVAGASRFATSLSTLVKQLRAAPAAKRNRLLAEFDTDHIPGIAQFDRATAALAAKGYRFSPNGGT
jgi:hypothetical protein